VSTNRVLSCVFLSIDGLLRLYLLKKMSECVTLFVSDVLLSIDVFSVPVYVNRSIVVSLCPNRRGVVV